jgi:hypothetical protein
MLIASDRTGFPLLVVEEAAVEVHLLPVTKLQFAQFVAETELIEPAYQAMLALNPAISHDRFGAAEREKLFVSGVLPVEALAFARWLGDGFDLPTVGEWRAIYAALRRVPPPRRQELADFVEESVGLILRQLAEQIHIRSIRDFSLMEGGLVEWVYGDKEMVGLGGPRPEFQPNLWDVLSHEIKPIRPDQRLYYFGFRLVRRGDWYLSAKHEARYIF